MHDPNTVAHEIIVGSHCLVTIWHVDPELDGSDDSCGWFSPKITDRDKEIIEEIVSWDKKFPYYGSPNLPTTKINPAYDYHSMLAGDCLAYVASAWSHIAWSRDRRRRLTADEWWTVVDLATSSQDNLRAPLVNPERDPNDRVKNFVYSVMRGYLRHHRPGWRHPRWHVRHWKFQVHSIQALKRWLFSRCEGCGRRFAWGYSPTSVIWDGTGPRWFRGENGIYHHECYAVYAGRQVK